MKHGLTFFPTDTSIAPAAMARAAEERGFESVWFAEHSHIPESPATPGPPPAGEPGLPREYYAAGDPFVSLGMAAAATERLKLATGICLVPQRDVFQTAKQVATLDHHSGGRFLFGVGAGWNQPEIENHGTDFARRFAIMRDKIEGMKALWRDEKAEYHGPHVDFGPSYAWPKPAPAALPAHPHGGRGRDGDPPGRRLLRWLGAARRWRERPRRAHADPSRNTSPRPGATPRASRSASTSARRSPTSWRAPRTRG